MKLKTVVYFIRSGEGGPIKIGWALNLDKRRANMQTGNPDKLHVVATFPGGQREERFLHVKFKKHRLRGEWFHAHEEILLFIEAKKFPRFAPMPRRAATPADPDIVFNRGITEHETREIWMSRRRGSSYESIGLRFKIRPARAEEIANGAIHKHLFNDLPTVMGLRVSLKNI